MTTLKQLEKSREGILRQLAEVNSQIEEKQRDTLVQCTNNAIGKGCGMGHKIRDLVYICTHWYESPWGCTGGAMWHEGEGQFDCPNCGHRNRLYDRKDIMELKYLFGSIEEEYKD